MEKFFIAINSAVQQGDWALFRIQAMNLCYLTFFLLMMLSSSRSQKTLGLDSSLIYLITSAGPQGWKLICLNLEHSTHQVLLKLKSIGSLPFLVLEAQPLYKITWVSEFWKGELSEAISILLLKKCKLV